MHIRSMWFGVLSLTVAQLLLNTARPFVYSTALPPPVVAGALAALDGIGGLPDDLISALETRAIWAKFGF